MQIQLDDLCISGVSLPLVRNTELDLGRAVIFHHFTLTQYCKLSCESEMPRHDTTQKKITLALTQNDIVQ